VVNYTTFASSTDYVLYENTTCEACPSYPICQNGGTCTGGANQPFDCSCLAGYTDPLCNTSCNCGFGYQVNTCNSTGYCQCKPYFSDPKCTVCQTGFYVNGTSCASTAPPLSSTFSHSHS